MIILPTLVFTCFVLFELCEAAENASAPALSIAPSLYWDGDDGQWSTFFVRLGTPPQSVRLIPGTSESAGDSVWAVIPEGCSIANKALPAYTCSQARGGTFLSNESTSWSTQGLANGGLFQLNTFEEGQLGLTGNAEYGYDTIHLGLSGSALPTVKHQLIAGIATNNYWLGSLGLSPVPFNFTNLDDPIPSLLTTLKQQGEIPSLSWAYTAGFYNHEPAVFGSLTLGGYDTTRFEESKTLSDIPFGADFSRDLLLQLNSITFNTAGSSPLLAQSIYVFIDSMVSQMWLPKSVCQAFEQAFDLTWDSKTQLYLINDTVHSALVQQNPTFTFTLGSGGKSVDVVLPYAAFDLEITNTAIASGTSGYTLNGTLAKSRYFPLKQAQNDSQYTLGRVFLQEAYVIADYERRNFSISQATFPSTGKPQQLVPILPVGAEVESSKGGSTLSGGAIAGIVVGVVVLLALIIGAVIWFLRRKRKRAEQAAHPIRDSDPGYSELAKVKPELDDQGHQRFEMDQTGRRPELQGHEGLQDQHKYEMGGAEPQEMGAKEMPAQELEAPMR